MCGIQVGLIRRLRRGQCFPTAALTRCSGRCASCAPAWLALGFLGLVTAPVG
jgi:hypothetical protein